LIQHQIVISRKSVSPFWVETSIQTEFSFKFESCELRGGWQLSVHHSVGLWGDVKWSAQNETKSNDGNKTPLERCNLQRSWKELSRCNLQNYETANPARCPRLLVRIKMKCWSVDNPCFPVGADGSVLNCRDLWRNEPSEQQWNSKHV
jgi:hypothetical protein